MGTGFNRVESAGFMNTVPNETITIKLVDKSLCWEDRGAEVRPSSLTIFKLAILFYST